MSYCFGRKDSRLRQTVLGKEDTKSCDTILGERILHFVILFQEKGL